MSQVFIKLKVYEIEDEDVLNTFFGENQKPHPIADIAKDHATKIYDNQVLAVPDGNGNDVIVINGDEYVVIVRAFDVDTDVVTVLVHKRLYVEIELS
jgi:hypothetical protein